MDFYKDNNYFFVTCRTLSARNYFHEDDRRQLVLDQLLLVEKFFKIKFIAYSILLNHYHLMFYLKDGLLLKKIMQKINGGISYKMRNVNKPIWGDYHNSNVFNKESFYKVLGYIAGNPFKHSLVTDIPGLKDYKYCNYNELVNIYGIEGMYEIIGNVKRLNWEINL
jgi:REP element-mobilizing transposase RayT